MRRTLLRMTAHDGVPLSAPSSGRAPELVYASSFPDLVAVVPSLLGLHPRDSLVIVPFLGARAVGGFRIPLPKYLGRSAIDVLACGSVQAMAALPRADAALAVVYTATSFAASRGIPLLELGRAVLSRLEHTPLGIIGVACVASDGWGRYTEPDEADHPRSLVEIEVSEAGLLARAAAPDPLDLAQLAVLPHVDASDRATVAELCSRNKAPTADALSTVERWLMGPPILRREARVIQILQSRPLRDQVIMQIARGPVIRSFVRREGDASTQDRHDVENVALLCGSGPGPDRQRLERATTALARAAALAPMAARPSVLTVLAWCWWARGVGSLAALHLEEALHSDPGCSVARLYRSVFAGRSVPEWVIDGASDALMVSARR
ncbi:DUF4192 domain-containing protein [Rathayibacter toxicus]|nr:DUF4192 domain-containing protein [Rathayibacter toxicus]PPG46483.1 DUF4192 domain-containing protein [Rathayibacter toxicus]PPH63366.1 DUF4192 domain-containing protein [Rathayibacter toxicus]PPH67710.1 DUF4192 domain-containing protein [Rathayibacter toxicus]PPH72512.1 DUF4192 domain-containing protein [Rathayibacter toxicus]